MDGWADMRDALSFEPIYDSEVSPARSDARVTLGSLPAELLQSVIDYSKNKTILSLMRVNRLMYSVALRKFYETIYLRGHGLTKALSSLDSSLPIEELLPSLFDKKYGVLSGLLHAKHHIGVLKTLHVLSFPNTFSSEHTMFEKILRYIVEHAVSIHTIRLPFVVSAPSAIYDGMAVSPSLDTLTAPLFTGNIANAIMRSSHLRTLHLSYQCASAPQWQDMFGHMSDTLCDFQGYVHVLNGEWDGSTAKFVSVVSKLTHLKELTFGFCSCTTAIPTPTEFPIKFYALVAAAIPSLTSLTFVDSRDGTFQGKTDLSKELALITTISQANANLREINIRYMNRPNTSNYDRDSGDDGRTIQWAATFPEEGAAVATADANAVGALRIWTPAPHLRSRWPLWHDAFGNSADVLIAMTVRWASRGWAERMSRISRWDPQPQPHLPSVEELKYFMNTWKSMQTIGALQFGAQQ